MLLRSNFSSFPHYSIYIFLTSGVKLHIHLLNVFVQFTDFHTLSTLICRGTNISKCFSESLGIRDNESRLYVKSLMVSIGSLALVPQSEKNGSLGYMQLAMAQISLYIHAVWSCSLMLTDLFFNIQ